MTGKRPDQPIDELPLTPAGRAWKAVRGFVGSVFRGTGKEQDKSEAAASEKPREPASPKTINHWEQGLNAMIRQATSNRGYERGSTGPFRLIRITNGFVIETTQGEETRQVCEIALYQDRIDVSHWEGGEKKTTNFRPSAQRFIVEGIMSVLTPSADTASAERPAASAREAAPSALAAASPAADASARSSRAPSPPAAPVVAPAPAASSAPEIEPPEPEESQARVRERELLKKGKPAAKRIAGALKDIDLLSMPPNRQQELLAVIVGNYQGDPSPEHIQAVYLCLGRRWILLEDGPLRQKLALVLRFIQERERGNPEVKGFIDNLRTKHYQTQRAIRSDGKISELWWGELGSAEKE